MKEPAHRVNVLTDTNPKTNKSIKTSNLDFEFFIVTFVALTLAYPANKNGATKPHFYLSEFMRLLGFFFSSSKAQTC